VKNNRPENHKCQCLRLFQTFTYFVNGTYFDSGLPFTCHVYFAVLIPCFSYCVGVFVGLLICSWCVIGSCRVHGVFMACRCCRVHGMSMLYLCQVFGGVFMCISMLVLPWSSGVLCVLVLPCS
jgi:hypothetical protein